ncbi:MAG TPA: hypothetical protein VMZ52_12635, partial [Bryobacteraceae bacterium]|nr:hypothetical protein [Bryobacteraceae bacterium]
MSNLFRLLVCIAGGLLTCAAQETAAKATPARVVGEVTSLDAAGQSLSVKSDAGAAVMVPITSETRYLRVPPGEQDLKKATKIGLQDISVGDRVLALSKPAEGEKPGPATSIIVMTKSDIAQKQAAEHAEWQKRGIAGKVTALNPQTKEITVNVPTRGNPTTLIVEAADKVQFRRYAPDSVRFSEAKLSSFADLKVGDQVRILGEKNAENTRVKPEMIVSGTFHNIAGTITSIDSAAGEIKITNLATKKPLIVK